MKRSAGAGRNKLWGKSLSRQKYPCIHCKETFRSDALKRHYLNNVGFDVDGNPFHPGSSQFALLDENKKGHTKFFHENKFTDINLPRLPKPTAPKGTQSVIKFFKSGIDSVPGTSHDHHEHEEEDSSDGDDDHGHGDGIPGPEVESSESLQNQNSDTSISSQVPTTAGSYLPLDDEESSDVDDWSQLQKRLPALCRRGDSDGDVRLTPPPQESHESGDGGCGLDKENREEPTKDQNQNDDELGGNGDHHDDLNENDPDGVGVRERIDEDRLADKVSTKVLERLGIQPDKLLQLVVSEAVQECLLHEKK